MSEMIQGYKVQSHINSMDFNSTCNYFATGGRDSIKIFGFNRNQKCWFESKRTFGKYKNTTITRACVSQLAWNKEGTDAIAIGTTSGLVLVYDAQSPYKNIMQIKGHQGNIKNIEWNPGSRDSFISSSFQNEIIQWDVRAEKAVNTFMFAQNTKIRDVKFNPHRPEIMAVQSSTKLELIDLRRWKQAVATYQIHNNQMQGIGVQWDPMSPHRIATAISKEINVFDVTSNTFEFVEGVAHYSLIKSFYWMKTKPLFFGIMGEHPQKNLFFYDLQDKNRMAYMYSGHGRSIDCWRMNNNQSIILSVSNQRERSRTSGASTNSFALVVAQFTQNYYDPNQNKFNHPISFDNDCNLAFCLNGEQNSVKKSTSELLRRKSSKKQQTPPIVYNFKDYVQYYEVDQSLNLPFSMKQQIIYLAKNYLVQGYTQQVALHNSKIASALGKPHCAELWKNLFQIAYPPEQQELTLEAIYERKLNLDISIVQNRVVLYDKDKKIRTPQKIEVQNIIQWFIDQYAELQTAAIAVICLLSRSPKLLPEECVQKVFTPYIQLLRSLQLFEIAAETIVLTKTKKYTEITENDTKYNLSCGSCKMNISKGQCKCNLLCVICEGRLSERLVIWCKYCGHGGHAVEYETWFKVDKKKYCPHGCGHTCFTTED